MRYAVDASAIRGDADVLEVVLMRLTRIRPGDELGPVLRAVPGGETARASGHLLEAWRERMAGISRQFRGLGVALAAASDSYGRVESVARSALAGTRPGRAR